MQYFSGDKGCTLEIDHCVDHFVDRPQARYWMQTFQEIVTFRLMHRRVDNPSANCVETDAGGCVLDRQTLDRGVDCPLAEVRAECVEALYRLSCKRGRDRHYVAALLIEHVAHRWLRDIKEAISVRGHHRTILLFGVLVKVAGSKDASIIDDEIYTSNSVSTRRKIPSSYYQELTAT